MFERCQFFLLFAAVTFPVNRCIFEFAYCWVRMLVSWHWTRKGAVQHEKNTAVGGDRSDFGDDGWLQSDISPAIFTAASFS
jgi:hypothetical protein